MLLPIRILGQDASGNAFSQLAHTLDFSRRGARLGGVQASLKADDEITVEYKRNRGRFIVRWVLAERNEAGIEALDREKPIFLELSEGKYFDDVDASRSRQEAVKAESTDDLESTEDSIAEISANETETPSTEVTGPGLEDRRTETQPVSDMGLADLKRKVKKMRHDPEGALQVVANASQELLSATGSAVAVVTGEDWICRASSGIAPRIGVRFRFPKGLTGEAAASGDVVICKDTEKDTRVNPSIWRSAQLRSAVSVPIMRNTKILGVLEAFASGPDVFDKEHLPLLHELGQLLAEILTDSSKSSE
jgi:putative methionine-R-sulfoxide reductase with GAF domain